MELSNVLARGLPLLQWALIVCLFLASGLAWSFILWVIPIIKLPLTSSHSAIAQFEETVRRGGLILAPVCITLAASLALASFLASKHPDPAEASTWKAYAVACLAIVQVGWYEAFLIAPVCEKIVALEENFKGLEHSCLEDRTQVELFRLIDVWTVRHIVRATLPLVSGMIVLSSAVF